MTLKEKLLELKNSRAASLKAAEEALEKGDMDEHGKKMAEVKGYNAQIEATEDTMAELEKGAADPEQKSKDPQVGDGKKPASGFMKAVKALADAARRGFKVEKAQGDNLSEGEAADGGYTVPEDIVTKIEERRDAKESLRDLVTVVRVKTNKGARTFKKRKQLKGFATVAEAAKIPKSEGPEFERVEYSIEKRGGFLPVTNELLEDSDENISQVVVDWMGDEARVTDNKEIVEVIKAHASTELKSLDDIITAWIKLGSAFRATSAIITNDDGLGWLATLKDKNDRYLLSPNPADPKRLQLAAGPHVIPIKTYDNDTLPSEGTKIPLWPLTACLVERRWTDWRS